MRSPINNSAGAKELLKPTCAAAVCVRGGGDLSDVGGRRGGGGGGARPLVRIRRESLARFCLGVRVRAFYRGMRASF